MGALLRHDDDEGTLKARFAEKLLIFYQRDEIMRTTERAFVYVNVTAV